jgi:lipopolysaccharide/colanic/teichoic acid biosynthesis glycosyltransferase
MAFIGPRPLPLREDELNYYTPFTDGILPGVTGIAQVYNIDITRMRVRQRLELRYEQRRNICSDVLLIAKTLHLLLVRSEE